MSNSLLQSYQINIGGEKSKLAYLIAHQILLERRLRELRQRSPLRERLLRLRSGLRRLAPPQARRIGSRASRPPTQIKERMNKEREIGDIGRRGRYSNLGGRTEMELRSHALLILSFIRSGERDRSRRTPRSRFRGERGEKLRGSLERSQGTEREKGREAEIGFRAAGEGRMVRAYIYKRGIWNFLVVITKLAFGF